MPKEANMNTFIEDGLRDKVIPMNNSDCKDCAECCSMGAKLTEEEYEYLRKYLKKDKYGRYLYQKGVNTIIKYLNKGTIYWLCPFSVNKRCQIYSKRPIICKNFHCDNPPEENKEFRDGLYAVHSKTIADLFRKDTFDRIKKE